LTPRIPAVGTLYVVSAPTGDPGDLTRRALRILKESTLVVAEDEGTARQLLDQYGLGTPLASAAVDACLEALAEGDVSLLFSELNPAPLGSSYRIVRRALDRGHPVVPVPGANLPITALVISGLPADSFLYLGELPRDPVERRELLLAVRAEQRSMIAPAPSALLVAALADLHGTLGDRALAVVSSSARGAELVWRGRCAEVSGELAGPGQPGTYVLVVGGAPDEVVRWDEDRLSAEIQRQQAAGRKAKEISQKLARDSGWSRREIYRLTIGLARSSRSQGGEADGS
jgi:16S rRNA (cytidine1402-2'-O)-methyltransferase